MNTAEEKVHIEWDMRKSIQKNFKVNNLQLVHYRCNNVMEPWKDTLLQKYVREDIIKSNRCISMRIYDDDRCALYTPYNPRTVIRTPIFTNENMTIKFTVSFNDDIDSKFFWFRDTADLAMNIRNVFDLHFNGGYIYLLNKHDDYVKLTDIVMVDELVEVEIKKEGGRLYININGDEFINDVEFGESYWVNLGLMNDKLTENSINIYDFSIRNE